MALTDQRVCQSGLSVCHPWVLMDVYFIYFLLLLCIHFAGSLKQEE